MKTTHQVHQIVDKLTAGIAGIRVKDIDDRSDLEQNMNVFQVNFDCWAPSLHTREYGIVLSPVRSLHTIEMVASGMDHDEADQVAWEMTPEHIDISSQEQRLARDPDLMHDVVRFALDDFLESQCVLSVAAAANGIAHPLGRGGDHNGIRVDHLHANSALLDLLLETLGPEGAWHRLQEGLLHALLETELRPSPWYMSEDECDTDGTCTILATRSGLMHLDVATPLGTSAAERAGIIYERDGISIPLGIPHSLLSGAQGRALGTIIATGRTDLDAAEIPYWDEDDEKGRTYLSLDLPVVRIAEHPGLRSRG